MVSRLNKVTERSANSSLTTHRGGYRKCQKRTQLNSSACVPLETAAISLRDLIQNGWVDSRYKCNRCNFSCPVLNEVESSLG